MIRLGVIGLGAAGQAFLPAIIQHPGFELEAVCDSRQAACEKVSASHNVRFFLCIDDLLAAGGLDAVYIGTPTDLHFEHVGKALDAGLHVLVEKPMTVELTDALSLAETAEARGLALTVGHSHSFDLPVRTMRDIISSGRIGRPRMINSWCFSDWVYRPRRPEELKPELGGGVTYRQGAHQFDILCALATSPVRSVRAQTFDWDPARPTVGAHTVMLCFEDGAVGTAVYNGYGFFQSSELTQSIGEWGFEMRETTQPDRAGLADEAEELERKQERASSAIGTDAPHQPHFGLTIVSCEKGNLRQTADGLLIYSSAGREHIPLGVDRSPRYLVMDEFADAIAGRPTFHTGRHGVAVTEICKAALESARTGREIGLHHQQRSFNPEV